MKLALKHRCCIITKKLKSKVEVLDIQSLLKRDGVYG